MGSSLTYTSTCRGSTTNHPSLETTTILWHPSTATKYPLRSIRISKILFLHSNLHAEKCLKYWSVMVDPDEVMDSRCPYGYTFHAGRCMKLFEDTEDCITAHETCRYRCQLVSSVQCVQFFLNL